MVLLDVYIYPTAGFITFAFASWWDLVGLHPPLYFFSSSVFVCPVRANSSLAFVGLVALSFSSWTSWQCTFSFYGYLETLAWYHIIHLPDRHLPAFSLASSSCSALIGGRTWRSRGLPSHFSCIHGRDTGHHCRYGCLFPFWCGSQLIFFLCKGSPSVIRQVPVARLLIPTQIFQQPSAFSS